MRARLLRAGGWALRCGLGALFFYTGVAKLREPLRAMEAAVASFRLVPDGWVSLLAGGLPFFEALAGVWLMLGWRPRPAALALSLLNLVFIIAWSHAAVRGFTVLCGCFGPEAKASGPGIALGRDFLLLAASLFLYLKGPTGARARLLSAPPRPIPLPPPRPH